MKRVLTLAALSMSLLASGAPRPLPFYDSRELTPYWPSEQGGTSFEPAQVTSFQVMDQDAAPLNEKAMAGHLSLVNFFFAGCGGICPTMMKTVQRFQSGLGAAGKGVKIYSFSVTPERDTPRRLREYARSYGIRFENWSLLTGDRQQIYRVGRDVFKADGAVGAQKKESSFIHTRNLYLVDSKLRIRGIYDTGDAAAMRLLAKDIAQLEGETEAGR